MSLHGHSLSGQFILFSGGGRISSFDPAPIVRGFQVLVDFASWNALSVEGAVQTTAGILENNDNNNNNNTNMS